MEYTQTIKISQHRSDIISRALAEPGHMDQDETYVETASFLDGLYLVDVRLVGCGDEEPAWTEAILLKRNDNGSYSGIAYTDPDDEFLGEWDLDDHDGNTFTVIVKATP